VRAELDAAKLPPGYFTTLGGQFQAQEEATRLIGVLSAVSALLVFAVLYGRYRSALLAALVMVNVPLALVGSVLAQFGIPHVIGAAPRLDTAPIAAALVSWLRLAAEDWPYRRLLAILTHNYFRPAWSEWKSGNAATALARLVRELEIPSGKSELVRRVDRLASRAAEAAAAGFVPLAGNLLTC